MFKSYTSIYLLVLSYFASTSHCYNFAFSLHWYSGEKAAWFSGSSRILVFPKSSCSEAFQKRVSKTSIVESFYSHFQVFPGFFLNPLQRSYSAKKPFAPPLLLALLADGIFWNFAITQDRGLKATAWHSSSRKFSITFKNSGKKGFFISDPTCKL